MRSHIVLNALTEGDITLQYTPTAEMVVDILSKGLPKEVHTKHARSMGLLEKTEE
jgi:hypothetical protein